MITIYHNARCSKSRTTLALIEEKGITPEIIDYQSTPPDAATLANILKKLDLSARDIMRKGEQAYKDNNLANPDLSEAELIKAMVENPKVIERPIVVKGDRAVLGRPPENVLELL